MPGQSRNEDGTNAFRRQIAMAAGRYRLERLARASWPAAWGLAVASLVVLMLALATPLVEYCSVILLMCVCLSLGFLLMTYAGRPDRRRLLGSMDGHGKLPDSVLSAGDWEMAAGDPWRERQRKETLRLLEKIDWRRAWPIHWPRFLWLPLLCSLFIAITVWKVQADWLGQTAQARLAARQQNVPLAPEQLKPIAQIFQDWDEAQKIAPSPELEELLKQIKPLREQMTSGKMTEKQLFMKLNELQARLEAARDKLQAASLEPVAQSLANAVKDLDGMSGLAAALQRKDFAAARDQAAEAEKKYNSGAAKMPEGSNAQTAADRLSDAAQKASGDAKTSEGLRQMQGSLANKDGGAMGKGLSGLKEGLGRQAAREGQGRGLGMQLAQLGQGKNGLGNSLGNGRGKGEGKGMGEGPGGGQGQGMHTGLPQLSLAKLMEEQKGAGTGVDPNRVGPATQLDASHQEMKITGTAGAGASETQTESTMDPHSEQTPSSVNGSQFAAYKKMSEQATEDENLPVADRQMIKRYFEDIRPQGAP